MPGSSGFSRTAFAYSQRPGAVCLENVEGRGMFGCYALQTQAGLEQVGAGFRGLRGHPGQHLSDGIGQPPRGKIVDLV